MDAAEPSTIPPHHPTVRQADRPLRRRAGRIAKSIAKLLSLLVLGYIGIVLIGLVPVHSDFQPSEDGVEIFVISNAVHADLVLPVTNDVIDWRDIFSAQAFPSDTADATHIAIGWGDKGFFLFTKTWADLKLSVAAKALLWPSDACVHVNMTDAKYLSAKAKSVKISSEQYRHLVDAVRETLTLDEAGNTIQVDDFHYNQQDAFFDAGGTYHCLNTCNSWVGRKLKAAGVKVPWMSPLPKTVHWYFP